jgi:ribosome maturation factor RimP
MATSSLEDRITGLLTVPISKLGVELVDVEFTGGTLRVLVDTQHEPPSGGVDTSTLATVNRAIGPILDEDDPIPGRYTLEVSSPGVERRLARLEHYQRAVGEDVVVKLVPGAKEYRRVRGQLTAADPDAFVVTVVERDGTDLPELESETISYADVERTKTVFNWGPSPKPHSTPRKKKSKNSKKK